MTTLAIGAATISAIAAAVSALGAATASAAAWLTFRGRRPKLEVDSMFATRSSTGTIVPNPDGPIMGVRARNGREAKVEVTNLWFEPKRTVTQRLRKEQGKGSLVPPSSWYGDSIAVVPGSIEPHHVALYLLPGDRMRRGLRHGGAKAYRPVVQIVGDRKMRGKWVIVDSAWSSGNEA